MTSSLRHLCFLCVSAFYWSLQIFTAETQRTQRWRREVLASLIVLTLLNIQLTVASPVDDLQRSFLNPPDDTRIMMRWWWFGPAVTKAELEREMHVMRDAGIGGFEVQPVYPLSLDDETLGIKTLPFLSDEFLDALRFTSEKARQL